MTDNRSQFALAYLANTAQALGFTSEAPVTSSQYPTCPAKGDGMFVLALHVNEPGYLPKPTPEQRRGQYCVINVTHAASGLALFVRDPLDKRPRGELGFPATAAGVALAEQLITELLTLEIDWSKKDLGGKRKAKAAGKLVAPVLARFTKLAEPVQREAAKLYKAELERVAPSVATNKAHQADWVRDLLYARFPWKKPQRKGKAA